MDPVEVCGCVCMVAGIALGVWGVYLLYTDYKSRNN
jgi:hypothetical protein